MIHYSLQSYDNLQGECYSTSIDEPCWGAAILADLEVEDEQKFFLPQLLIHLCEGHFNGGYEHSKYPQDNINNVIKREI